MVKTVGFTEKVPISSHLRELKDRVVVVSMTIGVTFAISYVFLDHLLGFLQAPIPKGFNDLTFISPTEPLFTALRVCFLGALFLSMPVILHQIWKFISPGLKMQEQKITMLFVVSGTLFFLFGGAFCYFLVMPIGLKYLLSFGTTYWKMNVTIGLYYTFVVNLIMAFAFAFQTPLIMVLLTKLGLASTVKMRLYRKWAFLGAFVIGAILTPPDVITQTLLSLPLYGLYEFGVVVSYFFEDPKQREETIRQIIIEREARKAKKAAQQQAAEEAARRDPKKSARKTTV